MSSSEIRRTLERMWLAAMPFALPRIPKSSRIYTKKRAPNFALGSFVRTQVEYQLPRPSSEPGQPTFFSRLAVIAVRILSNQADAVIVKSQEMASKLKRQDDHIITHEIDLEVFRPA